MMLSKIIFEALELCHGTPGKTRKVCLKNGLEMYFRINGGKIAMALARVGVQPSPTEWRTCMRNMPGHLQNWKVVPKVTQGTDQDERVYMAGEWAVEEANPLDEVLR